METDFREQHALEWKQVYKKLKEHKKSHLIRKGAKKTIRCGPVRKGGGGMGSNPCQQPK